MVQIIQSGPSTATLRQQALDQALQGAVQGYSNYQKQESDKGLTQRQQALQIQDTAMKLRERGYDVTPDQVAQTLQGPKEQSAWDKFTGKEAPAQTPIDLYGKRTEEYIQKQEAEKQKSIFDQQVKQADLGYRQAQTNDLVSQTPFKSQKMQAEIEKVKADVALSPITKRRMLAEIQKSEAEVANLPFQRDKLIAETQKAQRESMPGAESKLSKMSAEAQGKVGSIATGIKAIKGMGSAIDKGIVPEYIDSDTAFIGGMISDNDFTSQQKVLNEAFGRIQSGGAIGEQEIKNFKSLGPRPGDTPQQQRQKLEDQKSFLLNKLTAFGIKESEMEPLGFDLGQSQTGINQNKDASSEIIKQVQSMSRADKIKILKGGV